MTTWADKIRDIFETNPDEVEILDKLTWESAEEFGRPYGGGFVILKPEHLEALKAGKCLAYSDGEYSHFFVYEGGQ